MPEPESGEANYEIVIRKEKPIKKVFFGPKILCFGAAPADSPAALLKTGQSRRGSRLQFPLRAACEKCTLNQAIKIKFKSSNCLVLQFPQTWEFRPNPRLLRDRLPLARPRYSKFFALPLQYLRECLHLPPKMFLRKMALRLQQQKQGYFEVNPGPVRSLIENYFSSKTFVVDFSRLSVFDLLFITLVLYKKKYKAWRPTHVNLAELRRSPTHKRKDHLFKFFVKSLLSTLANARRGPPAEGNKASKIDALSRLCFENSFNFRSELKRLFNENARTGDAGEKAEATRKSKTEKLRSFARRLMQNERFSRLANPENLGQVVREMFREYRRSRMPLHIKLLVSKLGATAESPEQFFQMIRKQVFNPKFKSIWSLAEFKAAKTVFLTYFESGKA